MLGKIEYAKYIPQLKTHSKQKELERVWDLITKIVMGCCSVKTKDRLGPPSK